VAEHGILHPPGRLLRVPVGAAVRIISVTTSAEPRRRLCARAGLSSSGVVQMIPAPGGAHRDPEEAARRVKDAVLRHVRGLIGLPAQELPRRRLEKYLKMVCVSGGNRSGRRGPPT